MSELLQKFVQNPMFQLLSLGLGLIGIILAVLFYIKSRRYKAPMYEISSTTLIENLSAKLTGLEVNFKGIPQERITVSRLVFWNDGSDTIRLTDLTNMAPITIQLASGAKLLDASVVHVSEEANQFSIITKQESTQEDAPSHIIISFDYLDKYEGGVIQIVHTGKSTHAISVTGKVKGAGEVRHLAAPAYSLHLGKPFNYLNNSKIAGWIAVTTYVLFGLITLGLYIRDYVRWYLLPVSAISIFFAFYGYFTIIRRQVPVKFKKHLF